MLSHTVAGHEWINLQWLYDTCLYLLYRIGGANALICASVVAYVAAFGILIVSLRRSLGPVITAVLAAWVAVICEERFEVRPEMISFPLFALLLLLLLGRQEWKGKRAWWLLPIMVLWVNTHALYVVGVFAIGSVLLATIVVDWIPLPAAWRAGTRLSPGDRKRLAVAGCAASMATLVNPYLLRGVLFPFDWHARTVLLSRAGGSSAFATIGEFRPPLAAWFASLSIGSYQVFLILSLVVVALACLLTFGPSSPSRAGNRSSPPLDVAGLLIFVGLAIVSVLAQRNMALFALGSAPFLGQCLSILGSKHRIPESLLPRPVRLAASLLLAAGFVMAILFVASNRYYALGQELRECGLGVSEQRVPMRAAEFARAMQLPGTLYNDLTAGGYLTWAEPVPGGVYIDGRLEVYGDFYLQYSQGLANPAAWDAQAERFGINTVILFYRWFNRHPLIRRLNSDPRWSLVYFDEVAVVFVRTAGNGQTIARAQTAFRGEGWHARTLRRLEQEASPRWRFPLARFAAWDNLGTLYRILETPDGAAFCYERLLALDPPSNRSVPYRLWLADYYLRQGDRARAQEQLERAGRSRPDDAAIQEQLQRLREQ